MSHINPLEDVTFSDDLEPRCPCVLLLDTSSSMRGEPIQRLNEGIHTFKNSLLQDPIAARRVEVAIVTFDSEVRVVQDFIEAHSFVAPTLTEKGMTHMAAGIEQALDMIQLRKEHYRHQGIMYYRPWVFMITDGAPQGETESAISHAGARIKEMDTEKRVSFFAVGVEGADIQRLEMMTARTPLKLKDLNFNELFVWLSRSLQSVSRSKPGDQAALPPVGWSYV